MENIKVLSLLLCICFFAADGYIQTSAEAVWLYVAEKNRCVSFEYGDCRGNRAFKTARECEHQCNPNPCTEVPFSGSEEYDNQALYCMEDIKRYTYLPEYNRCVENNYAGCNGNSNRFKALEECERKCRKVG